MMIMIHWQLEVGVKFSFGPFGSPSLHRKRDHDAVCTAPGLDDSAQDSDAATQAADSASATEGGGAGAGLERPSLP